MHESAPQSPAQKIIAEKQLKTSVPVAELETIIRNAMQATEAQHGIQDPDLAETLVTNVNRSLESRGYAPLGHSASQSR